MNCVLLFYFAGIIMIGLFLFQWRCRRFFFRQEIADPFRFGVAAITAGIALALLAAHFRSSGSQNYALWALVSMVWSVSFGLEYYLSKRRQKTLRGWIENQKNLTLIDFRATDAFDDARSWLRSYAQVYYKIQVMNAEGQHQTGLVKIGDFWGSDLDRVEVQWDAGSTVPKLL